MDRGGRIALGAGLALTADIAPLAPGHLLLHTDVHIGSFSAVASETLARCREAIDEVLDCPVLRGRPVLLFEHGTDGKEPTEAGCTDHAHIHIMPVLLDEIGHPSTSASEAVARLHGGAAGPTLRFQDLDQLSGLNYFWLADRNLVLHTVRPEWTERQILRRIVAEALGLKRHKTWDLFDEDRAQETMLRWRETLSGSDHSEESTR